MQKLKQKVWCSGMLLGCALATGSAGALAATATVAKDEPATLDEVVVTATKRTVNIQQVPLSVSVLSSQELRDSTLTDTADLRRLVPGVEYRSNGLPIGSVFSMRGVGTVAGGSGLEQSVGVAVDGVPLASVSSSLADLVDISRVEALKGPQGMLFGKNASAGLINIVTNPAQLGEYEVIGRAYYGTYNNQQYSGTVNAPIGATAAVRLTAWHYQRDGIIDEVNLGKEFNNRDSEGARLKLRWDPSEQLSLNFTAEYTDHDQLGTAATIRQYAPENYTPFNNGAAIEAHNVAEGVVASPTNLVAHDGNTTPFYDRWHSAAYTLEGDYSVGEGNLTAIVSYRGNASNTSFANYPSDDPFNVQPYNIDYVKYEQYSGEFRYTSPASRPIRFVTGLFVNHRLMNDSFAIGLSTAPLPAINDLAVIKQTNLNYAAFGEATFDLTSQLRLTAGARLSHDQFEAGLNRSFIATGGPAIVIPGFNDPGSAFGVFDTNTEDHYNNVSWRFGLEYQIQPDALLYGTVSRGYKGPGTNYNVFSSAAQVAPSVGSGVVQPEIATAEEVGLKTQWFDRHLTVNLAVYNERFKDFQTAAVSPIANAVLTVNAGELQSRGVDLDANWRATPHFNLGGSVNYNHARYTDFKNSPCYAGQTAAEGCVPNNNPFSPGTQNLDGAPLVNAPDWTASLAARYETPVTTTLKAFGQVTDAYKSLVHYDSSDPHSLQKAVNLVHLSAGLGTADDHWRLTLYANNVFDKHFVDSIGPSQGGGVFYQQIISTDAYRTLGVSVDAHF